MLFIVRPYRRTLSSDEVSPDVFYRPRTSSRYSSAMLAPYRAKSRRPNVLPDKASADSDISDMPSLRSDWIRALFRCAIISSEIPRAMHRADGPIATMTPRCSSDDVPEWYRPTISQRCLSITFVPSLPARPDACRARSIVSDMPLLAHGSLDRFVR